jgi:hypothetical protein
MNGEELETFECFVLTCHHPFSIKPLWLIILIAYLVVTYVWYITERILAFQNTGYCQQVVDKAWPLMLARAA